MTLFSEWQPIETAPKGRTKVLLNAYNGVTVGYFSLGKWWFWECSDSYYDVEVDYPHPLDATA